MRPERAGFLFSIRMQLLASFLAIGLLPLAVVLWLAHDAASESIERMALDRLSGVARDRVRSLESLADARLRAIDSVARAPGIIAALRKCRDAIADEDTPQRAALANAISSSTPFLRGLVEAQGFADLMLLSPEGVILSSLERPDIVASGLDSPLFVGSGFARAFEQVSLLLQSQVSSTDPEHVGPGGQWVIGPVISGGRCFGFVAARLDGRELERLLAERTGLGRTGDLIATARMGDGRFLVVGPLRDDPNAAYRFEIAPGRPLAARLDMAMRGEEGRGTSVGIDGEDVLAAWSFSPTFRWAVTSEQDTSEAFAPLRRLAEAALVTVAGVVVAVVALALAMSRRLSSPLHDAVHATERMAEGDLTQGVDVRGRGETRTLLAAVNGTTSALAALVAELKEAAANTVDASASVRKIATEQDEVARDFGSSSAQIAAATMEMRTASAELSATVGELTRTAGEAAQAATDGRGSLATLSASMQRLESGTRSLSQRFTAVSMKAAQIDAVVAAITKVANQTNLLAVNASIEAEKAGAAGQGFQVVANEIDRLATQTAASALEIESTIASMQEAVGEGMRELAHFSKTVDLGCGSSSGATEQLTLVLRQVEELQASFEQLAVAIRAQAEGVSQVSDAMGTLADGARRTSAGAVASTRASDALDEAARRLNLAVGRFRTPMGRSGSDVHSAV